MTPNVKPEKLASLYAAAFPMARAWTANEFAEFLQQPTTFIIMQNDFGFALGRVVADEAELITLVVAPDAQRLGHGRLLLSQFEARAETRGAARLFLEVAADNAAALALYQDQDWCESARRCGYYHRQDGTKCDALLLVKKLT